jgi:hypothetical protein
LAEYYQFVVLPARIKNQEIKVVQKTQFCWAHSFFECARFACSIAKNDLFFYSGPYFGPAIPCEKWWVQRRTHLIGCAVFALLKGCLCLVSDYLIDKSYPSRSVDYIEGVK